MNPLVSGGGNTTVGTKDPGSTTKQPDPVTEKSKVNYRILIPRWSNNVYQHYIFHPGVDCGGTRGHADSCDECICYEQGEIDGKPLLSCGSRGDCGGDCQWKSSGSSSGMCVRKPGLLISTGRPVDQPAGRPAFLAILAGQNWPKLKMFRK